jgi:formylglycine-generating enzyme required for sulfatase activity
VFFLPNWIEWATPVLFMRSPDGQIFDVSATDRPAVTPVRARKPREEANHEKLASLYTEALGAYFTQQWEKAIEILSEIVSLDESYQDALAKLEDARRQKTLADLYADARRLQQAQNWTAVSAVQERIEALDPAYPDPEGLFATVKREGRLAALYQQGLQHMDTGEWTDALQKFEAIQESQAGYRETEALLARVAAIAPRPNILTITSPIHLELVRVPAGEFLMGSETAMDKPAYGDEQPQHRVHVAEFYIGKYLVTNAQYTAFTNASGHREAGYRGKDDHPVTGVSWHDAVTFCAWLGRETGQPYRLPTEAEWEKAARGTDGRIYPWGDQFDPKKCNVKDTGIGTTSAVGAFPGGASPYGVLDMSGNVWEWTRSIYRGYPYDPEDGREDPDEKSCRVLRGGAFSLRRLDVRCAFRRALDPLDRVGLYGFRCVVVPVSSSL